MKDAKAKYGEYQKLRQSIKEKLALRKQLKQEYDSLPVISVFKRRELTAEIAELTEEIEELRNEETSLIRGFDKQDTAGMKEVKTEMAQSEAKANSYWKSEQKYSRELNAEKQKFMDAKAQAGEVDQAELVAARISIRPEKEQTAISTLQYAVGEVYDHEIQRIREDVDHMLDEDSLEIRYRAEQRYTQREQQRSIIAKNQWER